jgi:hypothetical protein
MAIAGGTLPSAGLRYDPADRSITIFRGMNKAGSVLLQDIPSICDELIAKPNQVIDIATNRMQVSAVIEMMTARVGAIKELHR